MVVLVLCMVFGYFGMSKTCTKIGIIFFVHTNEYFEYLLWDLGYMGEKMFVMQ
jgi:hypothetical protein